MLKTLGAQVKEFKKDSFLTPCFMILEVLMETMIPFLMASIVDEGVNGGNISHIYRTGALMIGSGADRSVGWNYGRKTWSQGFGGAG